MKHLAVIFLFSLALFAQEIGVPYVHVTKGYGNAGAYSSFVLNGEAFLFQENRHIRLWNLKEPALNQCLTEGYFQEVLANRGENTLNTDSETPCKSTSCSINAFTANSEVMFLAFSGKVERWDLKTLKKLDEFQTPSLNKFNDLANFYFLSADDENHKLTAASFNHTLYLYDLPSMSLLQEFHGHSGQVGDVSPIIDDKYFFSVASASWDYSFRKWDITTGKEVRLIIGKDFSWHLPISKDGKYILLNDSDGNLTMYDTNDLKPVRHFPVPKNKGLIDFIVSGDEKKIYGTLAMEKSIVEWEMATGKKIRQIKLDHPSGRLTLSPNEKYLGGNIGNMLTFWRLPDFEMVVTLYPIGTCGWIIMTPEGYFNASEDAMASIRIKDPDGQERALTPVEINTYRQPKKVQAILNDIIATQHMEE